MVIYNVSLVLEDYAAEYLQHMGTSFDRSLSPLPNITEIPIVNPHNLFLLLFALLGFSLLLVPVIRGTHPYNLLFFVTLLASLVSLLQALLIHFLI